MKEPLASDKFRLVADRRLIFCISSGRAGSDYLATILDSAEEVRCMHEQAPYMHGKYLTMINTRPYPETQERRLIKCSAIAEEFGALSPATIYGETNHMFIKTFFDVALAVFTDVDVIILRRNLAAVLKSFIELEYFTPGNIHWPNWMSSPNARTAALPCIGSDDSLDQFDLCIGYLFDIEARACRFKREFPGVRTHEVRLEDLNDMAGVEKLFAGLGVTPTDETKKLCGQTVNDRTEIKRFHNNPTSMELCRERIRLYIAKAKALGIRIPDSAALDDLKV
jgi:hypothetical protein